MQNPLDPNAFSSKMTPAVQRAAKIARDLEGRVVNTPKLSEETDVKQALTQADYRAQEEILRALIEHYPTVSLEAEEDTPGVEEFRSGSDALVIIDPIDGTLQSYLEGLGPYSVIVGLALERRMHSALVALPREELLFRSSLGGGAEVIEGSAAPRSARVCADGDGIVVSHSVPGEIRSALEAEGLRVTPASGGVVSIAPLLPGIRAGLRLAPEESEAGVSVRGRVGLAIAREAGAYVRGDDGHPFPGDLDTPQWMVCSTALEEDQKLVRRVLQRGI